MRPTPSAPVLVDFGALVVVDLFTTPDLSVALEVLLPVLGSGVVVHVLLEGRPVRRVHVGSA
jgi:hypothetical protein